MTKVVAIIPARSGSKGVINKNIREIAGHPLLAYSVMAALRAQSIDDVFVSTDSVSYAEIAKHYGAKAPFLRPEPISGDKASDKEFVLHFFDWCKSSGQPLPDYIIHLRPTTPIRNPALIDLATNKILLAQKEITALRSIHKMSESAYKFVELVGEELQQVFCKEKNLDAINAPRQGFPETYVPNGYVDILKTEYILSGKGFHGDRVLGFETPVSIEIDREEDFDHLNYVLRNDPTVLEELF